MNQYINTKILKSNSMKYVCNFFIVVFVLFVSACDLKRQSQEPKHIDKQSIVNLQFKIGAFQKVQDYKTFDVIGPVRKISYYRQGAKDPWLPIDSIIYNEDGQVEYICLDKDFHIDDIERNKKEQIEFITVCEDCPPCDFDENNNRIDDGPHEYLTYFYNKKGKIDSLYLQESMEGNGIVREFKYDRDGTLVNLVETEYIFNCYKNAFDESITKYKVSSILRDGYGNWIKRVLISDKGTKIVEERKIEYFPNPVVIPVDSDSTIYCFTKNSYSHKKIWEYNMNSHLLRELIPISPEDNEYMYGCKDAKFFNKQLYVLAITGACGGPGNDIHVYAYDIQNHTWKFIIACGSDCEFVGNKIKAPIYWVTKEGSCSAENEYGDSIKWIPLR